MLIGVFFRLVWFKNSWVPLVQLGRNGWAR